MRSASSASSRSRAWRRISSTPLRDFMKQIVRAPAVIRSENTSAASYSAEARMPRSSSSSGGFHIATRRMARGAPSLSTRLKPVWPVSRSASSTGLAIVALASRKRGWLPWMAATRRRRRITLATWEPNTPR